jgi:hypothetical protein
VRIEAPPLEMILLDQCGVPAPVLILQKELQVFSYKLELVTRIKIKEGVVVRCICDQIKTSIALLTN